jgi:hypothetical protein
MVDFLPIQLQVLNLARNGYGISHVNEFNKGTLARSELYLYVTVMVVLVKICSV